ncbi:HD domain-containing protein [Streptomyces phaeochromogenes]|uniref:HD domain-containing protein n=1 Tax=Streptomyces phaeochromogenes TaxID=1923 RepID=UPI00386563C3|nr:HD domain-containing protein [Streptomyces phaeochromogenes]
MKARHRLGLRPAARTGTAPSLDGLLAVVRAHHPDADTALVEHAYGEAAFWHEGQMRRSGDPFITHCLAVAAIVADLRMPPPVVCAALLHDVDDTACPPQRIADQFGNDVVDLIAAVRTAVVSAYPQAGQGTAPRAHGACPSRERAVLAIRLADRLHNMRTIAFVAQSRQHLKARETLDVFAPVASAAGLDTVGRELQDLASAVLQPALSSHAVTGRLLATVTLLLPSRQRARWQEEWSADLTAHASRYARTRFTLRVLLGAPRLSMTLRRPPCREQR